MASMPMRLDVRVTVALALVGAIWMLGLWVTLFVVAMGWFAHGLSEAIGTSKAGPLTGIGGGCSS